MDGAIDEVIQTPENEVLILDGRISLQDYRDYWFEEIKGSLSNTIAFWGTAIAVSLWLVFLSRDSANLFVFFLFVSAFLFLIPLLIDII
jgi:hypothetical protein